MKIIENHPNVLKEPAPFVGVKELGDSSVNLAVRPYTKPENYWDVYFYVYEAGKIEGRYLIGELPKLDINDQQYDIALCSHFLFLYSEQFDYKFHLAAILEMLRIAKEVRIFPLLTLAMDKSPYLERLLNELETRGYKTITEQVKYELQKGGNEMLRITKR